MKSNQLSNSKQTLIANNKPKARILVADDDALVLATLSAGLRDLDYQVLEADCGEQAISLCKQQPPDLAILDVHMPGISGIETAKIIFNQVQVPFLFLSAFDDPSLVDQAVSEGALGYLVKPVDVRQIVPTIEAALLRSAEINTLRHRETHLSAALYSGREVSIAIGLIMGRTKLNAEQAEAALRTYARSERRKMSEIADELVQANNKISDFLQGIESNVGRSKSH